MKQKWLFNLAFRINKAKLCDRQWSSQLLSKVQFLGCNNSRRHLDQGQTPLNKSAADNRVLTIRVFTGFPKIQGLFIFWYPLTALVTNAYSLETPVTRLLPYSTLHKAYIHLIVDHLYAIDFYYYKILLYFQNAWISHNIKNTAQD